MNEPLSYLLSLSVIAKKNGHRHLVRLVGNEQWITELVSQFIFEQQYQRCIKLGGEPLSGADLISYKQGNLLLGKEQDCLIYDDCNGFDANSFTAASGSLCAGGIFFLILSLKDTYSYQWLNQFLGDTITLVQNLVDQNVVFPPLPSVVVETSAVSNEFFEQNIAISLIEKVSMGHRKRPLVLTADRGRGKSSALGLAAAALINQRSTRILVTAPSRNAVDPVFYHAKKTLENAAVSRTMVSNTMVDENKNGLSFGDSFIHYVSPDTLLSDYPDGDLLFVDEASAIPIPMLKEMLKHYHRVVFSSTIHGYEGCGRGFTLKFFKWLDENRSGWKKYHIHQPIRWNINDPLEQWVFDTFLLNTELVSSQINYSSEESHFKCISKAELLQSPTFFKQCFALLVNAHYQTSPNDMTQILDDTSVHLFVLLNQSNLVGCIVAKVEGELEESLISDISLGKRRPKGHLAPVLIAGQLGLTMAAKNRFLRIMRIAVDPNYQQQGIGSTMLTLLEKQKDVTFEYLATSFGVTNELLHFWFKNGYQAIRLGVSKDQASGTHSLLMLKNFTYDDWFFEARVRFSQDLIAILPEAFRELSVYLVLNLLKLSDVTCFSLTPNQKILIKQYAFGGSSYESIAFPLSQLVLEQVNHHNRVHPILISKLIQKRSWSEVASLYSLSGRKQAEMLFRSSIGCLLD